MTSDTTSALDHLAEVEQTLTALREAARDVLHRSVTTPSLRSALDDDTPSYDASMWVTSRELGWVDLLVPESCGGSDGTVRQLAALAEQLGQAGASLPLGEAASAAWHASAPASGVTLLLDGEGRLSDDRVSGSWPIVRYGVVADQLLLRARRPDGTVTTVRVSATSPGVNREALRPLDRNPAARIEMAEVSPLSVDTSAASAARFTDALLRARLATTAELVGVAAAANSAAAEYANVRVAFGRPIGMFQAIKHRLVDQRAAIEVGRALVNRAGDACDADESDWRELVALAAFWAVDRLRGVPEGAVQVFGGIGYTWEHEAHLHLRRAACLAAALGSRAEHRAVVAGWLQQRRHR